MRGNDNVHSNVADLKSSGYSKVMKLCLVDLLKMET